MILSNCSRGCIANGCTHVFWLVYGANEDVMQLHKQLMINFCF